ncbi:cell division protein FtsX [Gaoshiqia sp. Z1-71]|uniref:cell division protein FtsX n=1 Tax=Gaoshiqia hydrogeniformans TaxID=3290090 RepID=UPI003BF9277C
MMKKKKRPARLKRKLLRSYFTSTISITLVLFMVGLLSLLMLNAERLSDYVREHIGFTLVLHENVREVEVLQLQKTLSATNYVKSTQYIGKEEAAAKLAEELGEDFIGFLGFNPLFSSVDVKLYAGYMQADSLVWLENAFMEYPQIKEVYYQRDLVEVINQNVQRLSLLLAVFSLLLLLIFTTLVNNTIRITIYSQRFIINTMKLVGATRSFIRRPFILKNIFYGILGAMLANLSILWLVITYRQDFEGMIDLQQMETLGLVFLIVLAFGILISWISTHFSVNKYLRLTYNELF